MAETTAKRFRSPSHWTIAQKMAHYVRKGAPEECWPFTGSRLPKGYGKIWDGQTLLLAHRVAYALENGPVGANTQILHECDNPPCCNPRHLFPGTNLDNVRDMVTKGRNARGDRITAGRVNVRGEQHGMAKLTEQQVLAIFSAKGTQAAIAAQFDTSTSTVSEIRAGKRWAWLTHQTPPSRAKS